MSLSFETLFVLSVFGFYLLDSLLLLYPNELVFTKTGDRWTAFFPNNRYQISGRSPLLINIITPARPVIRLHWPSGNQQPYAPDREGFQRFIDAISRLAPLNLCLLILLFIELPIIMMLSGKGIALIAIILAGYSTIVFSLIGIYLQRADLRLSRADVAGLAFEALACPPLALNLPRKITLMRSMISDPAEFAREHMDGAGLASFVRRLSSLLDESMEFEDAHGARLESLRQYRARLALLKI